MSRPSVLPLILLITTGLNCGGRSLPQVDGAPGPTSDGAVVGEALVGEALTGESSVRPDGSAFCSNNASCKTNEYCHIEKGCTVTGAKMGECKPRPQGCTADCPGVCGCDGKTYCNVCGAHVAGTNVEKNGACTAVDPLCQGVTCHLYDNCCTCTALKYAIPTPACKVACKQPTCEGLGIADPFPYCVKGECLVSSKTKICKSDSDCYLYNDCCGCFALHNSILPPLCAADCFAGLCTSLGLANAKPRCVSGTCQLSVN
jgi:hypothetical protein